MENIKIAQEKFAELILSEYARIQRMREDTEVKDFSKLEKIIIGILPGDGIVPMVFADPSDYDRIDQMDELEIAGYVEQMKTRQVTIHNVTKGFDFKASLELSDNELEICVAGGQLRFLKKKLEEMKGEN